MTQEMCTGCACMAMAAIGEATRERDAAIARAERAEADNDALRKQLASRTEALQTANGTNANLRARAEAAEALAASRLDVPCPECCGPDSPAEGTTNCGTCSATGYADRASVSRRIRSLLDVSPRDVARFLLAYDESGCADVIADADIEHVASVVHTMAALRAHAAKVSR